MKNSFFSIAYLSVVWFALFFTVNQVCAQTVIVTAGEHVKVQDVQLSWTLGEPVIVTISADSNILTQGFHQGKITITNVFVSDFDYKIKVYPNPVSKNIIINIGTPRKLMYEIYSSNGKIMMHNVLESEINKINLESFVNGTYFLKIRENNKLIYTFQLVKIY